MGRPASAQIVRCASFGKVDQESSGREHKSIGKALVGHHFVVELADAYNQNRSGFDTRVKRTLPRQGSCDWECLLNSGNKCLRKFWLRIT